MNYLAHAALSQMLPEITLGNLIADHVRGPNLSYLPDDIAMGVRLHRHIDSYFDNHPKIIALRALMPQGLRRYSGIVIDFWFDHLLAKRWQNTYSIELPEFQHQVNRLIKTHWQWVPTSQHRFLNYLISEQLFVKYQHSEHIEQNLKMLSNRLKRGEMLLECMQALSQFEPQIELSFESVYPQVEDYSQNWIHRNA